MQEGETIKGISGLMLGRYQLLRRIGKGGMGEVWLGEDARLHRQVAIKTLPSHNQGDREYLQRFEREARAAAALNHPHILPVHDYGEQVLLDGQAVTYIVMPYISGGTLNEHIKALAEHGSSIMPPREVINYLFQAAQAIDYAHEQNVLHRDIKPSNMLLRSDDWLLLADFGIARLTSDQEHLTQAGAGIGTPEYMAPEQAQGKAVAASDNYSLAVIAYQLFTGQLPFKAETPYAITVQHIVMPPPPPREINPDISPAVEQAILHGLAKDPVERPPSAQAFVAELQHALEGRPYEVSNTPTLLLGNSSAPTEVVQPETLRSDSLVPGDSKLRVPPPSQGITRRKVLIGGGAALLVAAGLGTWAVSSKEHNTPTITTTQKPTPALNPGTPTFTLLAHTQPITALAWSPTSPNILASAAQDSQVMLWDIAAIQQGQASQTKPKAKQVLGDSTINSIKLAWSADGQALAIGNAVFNVESNGKLVDMVMLILKSDLSGLVPYFDQQYMTFLRTGFIRTVIWGPGKYLTAITFPAELAGKATYYLEFRDPLHPHQGFGTAIENGYGFSLALPPDASKLAVAIFSGISVGEPVVSGSKARWKTLPTLLTFDGTKPLTTDGSKPPSGDVTWSPDGRYVAGITNPLFVPKYIRSQLAIWDSQKGDSSRTSLNLPRSDAILTNLRWSPAPTSTLIAAGSKDGSVYLWSVDPGNLQGNALPVRTLTGPTAEVTALAWSSDGRYLAAGYNDTNDSILIWKM